MMKPENLGITSQTQQVVDALNNWAGECGKSLPALAGDPPAKDAKKDAFSDLYDQTDVEHVRNSWLIRQFASGVLHSQATDVDRVVGLFNLTVRTVAVVPTADSPVPQTAFATLVLGRGTPEDRAWLFGELLRQAGFDSVIVRPKTGGSTAASSNTSAPRWLVGVLLDKQVYLFDPTLGWPIPSPDDKASAPTVRQPATLAQAAAHDELLRKLDVSPDKKYPLKAADLKSVRVEIITSGRYSEPRMKRLESFLAGNRSAAVYAPLADTGGQPGLRWRVEAGSGGAWKKDDVVVWNYPDKQLEAAHHLEGQAKTLHDAYWLPFEGPVDLEFDGKTGKFVVITGTRIKDLGGGGGKGGPGGFPGAGADPSKRVEERHDPHRQIKSRIAQLQGDYPKAIRTYLNVQLAELPPQLPLPEEVQERLRNLPADKRPKGMTENGVAMISTPQREFFMNFRAAEDAKFWMGVCQMDQNELELAEETFSAYLRRYGQAGVGTWVVQAAYLHSLALAESKRFALAVASIGQLAQAVPENDFRRPTYQLLSERWRTARDAAKPHPSPSETGPAAKSSGAPAKTEQAKEPDKKTAPATTPKTAGPAPASPDAKAAGSKAKSP
jgi:hypothetical protein